MGSAGGLRGHALNTPETGPVVSLPAPRLRLLCDANRLLVTDIYGFASAPASTDRPAIGMPGAGGAPLREPGRLAAKPCRGLSANAKIRLDHVPIRCDRNMVQILFLIAFSTANRIPPRIKCRAGVRRKMLWCLLSRANSRRRPRASAP